MAGLPNAVIAAWPSAADLKVPHMDTSLFCMGAHWQQQQRYGIFFCVSGRGKGQ